MQTSNPYQAPTAQQAQAVAERPLSISQVLFSFGGRIPRSTYWLWSIALSVVAMLIIGTVVALTSKSGPDGQPTGPNGLAMLVIGAVYLVAIWISIALQVKRWHDRDKSGVWFLINLVPLIGGVWALIECGFLPGTFGPNQYGADPLSR